MRSLHVHVSVIRTGYMYYARSRTHGTLRDGTLQDEALLNIHSTPDILLKSHRTQKSVSLTVDTLLT